MRVFTISIIILYCTYFQSARAEVCTLRNRDPGTCEKKNSDKCKGVMNLYRLHSQRPQLCNKRLICCPDEKLQIPSPTGPSGQKCQEYSDRIYKNNKCLRSAISLIVDGEEAAKGEFPHSVLIGFELSVTDDKYVCGGSLVSERWVLSAAHCSFSADYQKAKYAKIGNVVRGEVTDHSYNYEIIDRVKHPSYSSDSIDHDIALFKLDRDVEFSSYVAPICLPHFDIKPKDAIASGWGQIGYAEPLSKVLLKVKLEIFNQTGCQEKFADERKTINGIDYGTKICAGSNNSSKDSCGGDSGGPLQVDNVNNVNCMYHIVGITSYGYAACGRAGVPAIYIRVYFYLKWIEAIVWPELN